MNLFNRLRWAVKGFTRPGTLVWNVGSPFWSTWSLRAYFKEGYQGNPYVYRATKMLGQACGGIKAWPVDEGGESLPDKHPLWALMRKPNPLQSWPEVVEAQMGYYSCGGQSFLRGIGPDTEGRLPPMELYPLGPLTMAPVPGATLGTLDGFTYQDATGKLESVATDTVFWFRSWDPLNVLGGLPAIKPATKSIDANNAALDYNKAVLDNGGIPGTVLTTDGVLGSNNKAELKKSFAESHGGASKAGRMLLLDGGLKPFKVGLSPQEMSFDKLITATGREVALVFGIPPELLGDASQKTFSNYREAREALYTDTVLPLLDAFYGQLGGWFSARYGEQITFAVDTDDVEALSRIRNERRTTVREDYLTGLLTLDQALEEMGYETVGGEEGEARRTQPAPIQFQGSGGKGGHTAYPRKARACGY